MFQKKYQWIIAVLGLSLSLGCSIIRPQSLKSGTELIIQTDGETNTSDETLRNVVTVLNSRLNALKVSGEAVSDQSRPKTIIVNVYGTPDLERVKKVLLQEGNFNLQSVVSPLNPNPMQIYSNREAAIAAAKNTEEVLPFLDPHLSSQSYLIVEREPIVSGPEVRDASAGNNRASSEFQIYFSLKPQGAVKLKEWSGKNIGHYLAIVLNKKVYSAPFIKSEIADSGVIEGRFTAEEAENLALIIKSGGIPVALKLISEKRFDF